MKSEFDSDLPWPVIAALDIELFNWQHRGENLSFILYLTGDAFCQRVERDSLCLGSGNLQIISLESLATEFSKFDSLSLIIKQFQCHSVSPSILQQLPPWVDDHVSVSFFTIPSCKELIKSGCDFYGPPFYSIEGHKLCLKVCLSGTGKGKGTHISVHAHIMQGHNDEKLSWPFHADILFSMLNWKANTNHIKGKISFNYAVPDNTTARVKNAESNSILLSDGCGLAQFCELSRLNVDGYAMQLLKDDSLVFKVESLVTYLPPPSPKAWVAANGKYAVPFEFVVTEFSKRRRHDNKYFSKPFYSHDKGYKLQMRITVCDSFLSCFVFLLKSENDQFLEWPFRADIVVELVNHRDKTKCYSKIISFTSDVPFSASSRVTENNLCTGFGLSDFILISKLSSDYTLDDSLVIRIPTLNVYSNELIMKVPRWLSRQPQYLEYNITGYASHKQLGTKYLSPSFYSHRNGYKMRLEIGFPAKANGYVTLHARLLRGEHDSTLQWPFTGNVHVQLLNWRQDKNHYSYNIEFHERLSSEVNGVISPKNSAARLCNGSDSFIEDHVLQHNSSNDVQYIQENCLRLRIKKTATYSKTNKQPYWQNRSPSSSNYAFTMDDFARRIEADNCFYSPSFYTSPQGYKMCLKIYANGYGDGKNGHVSVFVCFLKGEYDDFLQWPFEGDVVIELINWRENKNHHRQVLSFNRDVPVSYRQKKEEDVVIPLAWGFAKFIPHTMLFSQIQGSLPQAVYIEENRFVCFSIQAVHNYNTPLLSKSPSWKNWLTSSRSVCEFTLTGYSKHKEYGSTRCTTDFYTHKNGYKMRLEISLNGLGNSSLSVYARLLKGEHDDSLKWPMNVEVPVELVNWKKNSFHFLQTIKFADATSECTRVPAEKAMAEESWGKENFCSHSTIDNSSRDVQYIEEDCLFFRVKQPVIHSRKGFFA